SGKTVLVRVDFNVPMAEGRVADDRRIRETTPTLRMILERGGRLVLASHLGRPKGKQDPRYSLAPCREPLAWMLGREVTMSPDCVGAETKRLAGQIAPGGVLLLENLRFHAEEEANDAGFAASLASLADLYVNDAFGSAHRAHASVEAVCRKFQTPAAGLLMEREIEYLSRLLEAPARPYVAVLGGAKVSDKIELLDSLLARVDSILIGGAMAYTFLKARGVETGSSLVEADKLDLARAIEEQARSRSVRILLPVDHVEAAGVNEAPGSLTPGEAITPGHAGFDIGPRTSTAFAGVLAGARTILWNGPLGMFETRGFATGTRRVAQAIAAATGNGALSVVGGGDSAAAVKAFHLESAMSHISTGGGASLEFLSGRRLPGVVALADAR
ncbi:MAG TPA: phosphoglycerate kinase, partial [Verrucomicrobiae bacterium]|nr:phosphoglycerate kinase [Verrucomicrobiae bacterium]